MNSAFHAIWLVPLSRDIKYYSPPGGFRRKQMAREPHFVVKYSSYLGTAIKLVLYILKQLFAEVEVNSGGYLPRRSGSVNIHRYSPPLRRIIVNYHLFFFSYAVFFSIIFISTVIICYYSKLNQNINVIISLNKRDPWLQALLPVDSARCTLSM